MQAPLDDMWELLLIPQLKAELDAGRMTSEELVRHYISRIERINPRINAAISWDSKGALQQAKRFDAERAAGKIRGPLHGIPIALKDTIETENLPTSGGTWVLRNLRTAREGPVVQQLRDAGAIIMAKTNLTELGHSVNPQMPNGFSGAGGGSVHPLGQDLDVGGSSSGTGLAAGLWPGVISGETSGSIQIPSIRTGTVGLRPTSGAVDGSRSFPISNDQDTLGPMARSVTGVAWLYQAMHNPAGACPAPDYSRRRSDLEGIKVVVPQAWFVEPITPPGHVIPTGGIDTQRRVILEHAITRLKDRGATVLRKPDMPTITTNALEDSHFHWPACRGVTMGKQNNSNCTTVLAYGLKRDLGDYLASLPNSPVRSLAELRRANLVEQQEAIPYWQLHLDMADAYDTEADRERYEADRAKDLRLAREMGFDPLLAQADVVLFPGTRGQQISNRAGYPTLALPIDKLASGQPYGVTLVAKPCTEQMLLEIGTQLMAADK